MCCMPERDLSEPCFLLHPACNLSKVSQPVLWNRRYCSWQEPRCSQRHPSPPFNCQTAEIMSPRIWDFPQESHGGMKPGASPRDFVGFGQFVRPSCRAG